MRVGRFLILGMHMAMEMEMGMRGCIGEQWVWERVGWGDRNLKLSS